MRVKVYETEKSTAVQGYCWMHAQHNCMYVVLRVCLYDNSEENFFFCATANVLVARLKSLRTLCLHAVRKKSTKFYFIRLFFFITMLIVWHCWMAFNKLRPFIRLIVWRLLLCTINFRRKCGCFALTEIICTAARSSAINNLF